VRFGALSRRRGRRGASTLTEGNTSRVDRSRADQPLDMTIARSSRIGFRSRHDSLEDEGDMTKEAVSLIDRLRSHFILETPYDYASPLSRTAGPPGRLTELVELQRKVNEEGFSAPEHHSVSAG
jgi:hypothetical protein